MDESNSFTRVGRSGEYHVGYHIINGRRHYAVEYPDGNFYIPRGGNNLSAAWKDANKADELHNDEPCGWCNDEGSPDGTGEIHACTYCGSVGQ